MTKTPVEIYKKEMADFDDRFEQDPDDNRFYEREFSDYIPVYADDFKAIHKKLTLAILRAELERVEGMKKEPELEPSDIHESGQLVGYNTALTDHANYIKSQIKEIEGI